MSGGYFNHGMYHGPQYDDPEQRKFCSGCVQSDKDHNAALDRAIKAVKGKQDIRFPKGEPPDWDYRESFYWGGFDASIAAIEELKHE